MRSKKKGGAHTGNKEYPKKSRKRPVGCKRSVIRYIGSNVPIAPSKEAYYEVCFALATVIINDY